MSRNRTTDAATSSQTAGDGEPAPEGAQGDRQDKPARPTKAKRGPIYTRRKKRAATDDGAAVQRRATRYEPPPKLDRRVNRQNKRFDNYCPDWLRSALEPIEIGPQQFQMFRRDVLNMTQAQAAAYLRVSASTVSAWESGRSRIPFMAFETLRLMAETTHARIAHPEWEGWTVNRAGELCSPDSTVRLPEQAVRVYHFIIGNVLPALRSDVRELQRDLDDARAKLARADELMQAVTGSQRMALAKAVVRTLFDTELEPDPTSSNGARPAPPVPITSGALQPPPYRKTLADSREIDALLKLEHRSPAP